MKYFCDIKKKLYFSGTFERNMKPCLKRVRTSMKTDMNQTQKNKCYMNKFINLATTALLVMWLLPASVIAQSGAGKNAYKAAEAARRQGNYTGAAEKYVEAIKLEPQNATYYYKLGQCQIKQKPQNVDGAIESLTSATKYRSDYTSAYALLGKIYYTKKKDIPNAIQYFNQAANNEKDVNRKVGYKLQVVKMLVKQSNYSQAQSELNSIKSQAPGDPNVLFADGQVKGAMNNWAAAVNSYQEAVDKVKDLPPTETAKYYFGLGEAYWNLGQTQKAEETWAKVPSGPYTNKIKAAKSKNSPKRPFAVAMGYFKADELDEAMVHLNKAIELSNQFSPAYSVKGAIYQKKGQNSQAIQEFMKAADYEADANKKQKLYAKMIKVQLNAGDYSGVISTADKILAKTSSNDVKFLKAKAQYKLGQYSGAISTIEGLIPAETDANKKAAYNFIMGLSAKKAGDNDKAKKAFQAAMVGSYKGAAKKEFDTLSVK